MRRKLHIKIDADAAGIVTVVLIGEAAIDFDVADDTIEKILSHKPKSVIIDASQLTFISSVGMCFLLNLRRALLVAQASLKVAALQPLVQSALQHAHVLFLFETSPESSATPPKPKKSKSSTSKD